MTEIGKKIEATVKRVDKMIDNLKKSWDEARKAIEELKDIGKNGRKD